MIKARAQMGQARTLIEKWQTSAQSYMYMIYMHQQIVCGSKKYEARVGK